MTTFQKELERQITEYATTLLVARSTNDYLMEVENRRLFVQAITNLVATEIIGEEDKSSEDYSVTHGEGWSDQTAGFMFGRAKLRAEQRQKLGVEK